MPDAGSCACLTPVDREVRIASKEPLMLSQWFGCCRRVVLRSGLRDDAARSVPAHFHNLPIDGVGHIRRPTSFKAERDFHSCRRH